MLPIIDGAQVSLPIKSTHILSASGKYPLRYHKEDRWDVMCHLMESLSKDIWKQFKKLKGNKAILSDHYKMSTYVDGGYLNFTLSIQAGVLNT